MYIENSLEEEMSFGTEKQFIIERINKKKVVCAVNVQYDNVYTEMFIRVNIYIEGLQNIKPSQIVFTYIYMYIKKNLDIIIMKKIYIIKYPNHLGIKVEQKK